MSMSTEPQPALNLCCKGMGSLPFLPHRERGDAPILVPDQTSQEIQFNVMPERPVSETVRPKEYRIWNRYIEAEFDREYYSSMLNSPDHLIFLTALIQVQRMVYVYVCHEWRLPYEPVKPELLKIWPTTINVEMPKMVIQTTGLVHRLTITRMRQLDEKRFFAESKSDVNGIIEISATAFVYLL
jgi:hypothetical protein